MTEREKFEKFWLENMNFKEMPLGKTRYPMTKPENQQYMCHETNRSWFAWQAATKAAVPEGFKLVPVEPTAEQYGGLARDVIQWMRFTESSDQHSQSLIEWLKNMGNEIPSWLMGENEVNRLSRHVLSKGTIAAIIYKAMLEAAPKGGE